MAKFVLKINKTISNGKPIEAGKMGKKEILAKANILATRNNSIWISNWKANFIFSIRLCFECKRRIVCVHGIQKGNRKKVINKFCANLIGLFNIIIELASFQIEFLLLCIWRCACLTCTTKNEKVSEVLTTSGRGGSNDAHKKDTHSHTALRKIGKVVDSMEIYAVCGRNS